ncbi:MAG TPA: response regulator transcription factor [Candidatus Didemnitutus sp.]|nr:response regulator transcription factor [Candidatus Didemnitutus sp.]
MSADSKRRRVFLVDDHPLVREWLGSLIEQQPDLAVCGQAGSSGTAFEAISRLQPDIAVVDLSLEDGSGLELIKQLQSLTPPPKVLVLSMHDEAFYAERALRAGAAGYVMKRSATGRVIDAIRHVLEGRLYISEAVSEKMAEKFVLARTRPGTSPIALLSDREIEVFQMIGQGLETRRIAEMLHLSPKTVQVYCGRIKEKLGLDNATALIGEAVRWHEHQYPTV